MDCKVGLSVEAAPAARRLSPVYLFAFKIKTVYNNELQGDIFAAFWENITT